MAKLTISKMANLYGLSRGALYDKVSKGILTATLNEQGQKVIDMVDMIVLYGEAKTDKAVQIEQQPTVQNSSIQTELDSIELYKKMLEMSENSRLKAEQREDRLFNEISSLREEIKELMTSDPKGLEDAFYKNLEFGTGGMRGVMGVGTNRINKYTLGKNTQGLSDYLHKSFPNEQLKVAIAYDCRHNSNTLAKVVADVFSANGIKVYLFSDMRPTPELSFAVRYLNCHAGIVLTASHNPPEYNGYKV